MSDNFSDGKSSGTGDADEPPPRALGGTWRRLHTIVLVTLALHVALLVALGWRYGAYRW